jgi:low temperature requirement protein LtrA
MKRTSIHESRAQRDRDIPLELLFDLVFAFAISQFSDHLWENPSWRGAAETLVMLLAILAVWSYTSWAAVLMGDDKPGTRWMFLGVMLVGLFLNASVAGAFSVSGWAFVLPLLLAHWGRPIWIILNSTGRFNREHYSRVLLWVAVTTPLWLAGAAAGPETRLAWWATAAVLDMTGNWLAHPIPGRKLHSVNVPFDADHMLDRCRQFIIIALGETVVTTGTAIAGVSMAWMTLATGTFALLGTVALWALSFGSAHRSIMGHLRKTEDPIHVARLAVSAGMVIVTGLIAVAVANREVIGHPTEKTTIALSLMLSGGPILFLAAQGWYLWFVPKLWPRLHLIGGGMMLLVGLATLVLPAYAALILVGAWLTVLAIFDQWKIK